MQETQDDPTFNSKAENSYCKNPIDQWKLTTTHLQPLILLHLSLLDIQFKSMPPNWIATSRTKNFINKMNNNNNNNKTENANS
jgi:hypothetical protein